MGWYEYKFNKQRWLDSYQYESGQHRIFARGFAPFLAHMLDIAFNLRKKAYPVPSFCELGIGSGGSHAVWDQTLKARIYGVDIYSPDKNSTHRHIHEVALKKELEDGYQTMLHMQQKTTQCTFFCGVDGYTEQAKTW